MIATVVPSLHKLSILFLVCLVSVYFIRKRKTVFACISFLVLMGLVIQQGWAALVVITPSSGCYELCIDDNTPLDTGMYDVTFSHPGYFTQTVTVEVTAGGGTSINVPLVVLEPKGGVFQAGRIESAYGESEGLSIACNTTDNSVFVSGYFRSNVVFDEGGSNETILVSAGETDVFLAKWLADGSLAWIVSAGGPGEESGLGVSVRRADGTVVMTGNFSDTAVFEEGGPNETILVAQGGYDMFLAKYGADGALIWARHISGQASGSDVEIDLVHNIAVVTGYNFTGPSTKIFVAQFDDSGNRLWLRTPGGVLGQDRAYGVGINYADGSLTVAGWMYTSWEDDITEFGYGEDNWIALDSLSRDMFIASYNADGSLAWAKRAGGVGSDKPTSLSIVPGGDSFWVTGTFFESAIFGQGESNETTLFGDPDYNFFLARYFL